MSRSYKKYPMVKDHPRGMKKIANRKFRRNNNEDYLLQGGLYKKYFEQWDISDYKITKSFEEFYNFMMDMWDKWGRERGEPMPTFKELYRDWFCCYKGK